MENRVWGLKNWVIIKNFVIWKYLITILNKWVLIYVENMKGLNMYN